MALEGILKIKLLTCRDSNPSNGEEPEVLSFLLLFLVYSMCTGKNVSSFYMVETSVMAYTLFVLFQNA